MINKMRSAFVLRMTVAVMAFSFAAALAAQTTPTTQPPPTQNWKTYSYSSNGFSASFPYEPKFSKQNVPTDKGNFELRAYLVEDGQAALYVGVCDYGSAISDRTSDQVLDGAQQGAIDNVKAHLISGKKITLGVYPGREFESENDTLHFTARIYLVGTTLYQTLTAAPLGKPYDGVQRFLDSFQLIPRTSN
jgi:hypothetical protein